MSSLDVNDENDNKLNHILINKKRVSVCVCVRERETERDRDRERQTERETDAGEGGLKQAHKYKTEIKKWFYKWSYSVKLR